MIITHAEYTMVLKTIMQDIPNGSELLNKALSTYPLYKSTSNQEYIPVYIPSREELNRKLLNHYKYREIGFETVGRFLDELQIAMEEIMPYYNQLFFSADQDFNIIYNVDYKKTIDTERAGVSNTNTTGESSSQTDTETDTTASDSSETSSTGNNYGKTVKADTPQGELNIVAEGTETVPYASEAVWNSGRNTENVDTSGNSSSQTDSTTKTDSSGTSESQTNDSMTEGIVETTKGNFGVVSAQDLVLKYRETILNIEQMIINDARIQELFMLVF